MRQMDAATLAALEDGRFAIRALVRVEMPSGPIGFTDDAADLLVEGLAYLGKPRLFQIRLPASVADGTVQGVEIVVSGLDADVAAEVEAEPYHQRPILLGLVLYPADTPAAGSVHWWFTGFIDQIVRQERVDGAARLVVKCESVARELDRAGGGTRSDADQRTRDAADGFFKFTARAKRQPVTWGRVAEQAITPPAPQSIWDRLF